MSQRFSSSQESESWLVKRRRSYFRNWKAALTCFRRRQSPREAQLRRFFVEPALNRVGRDGQILVGAGLALIALGAGPLLFLWIANALGWVDSEQTASLGCLSILAFLLMISGPFLLLPGLATFFGLALFRGLSSKPPEIDAVEGWLGDSIQRLRAHSLAKLGFLEEEVAGFERQPPILTPILWRTEGVDADDLVWRSVDHRRFFGVYRICIVHLVMDRLGVYLCDFNFLRDVSLNDETMELSYQDVVTLSTKEKSSSLTLPTGKKLSQEQRYSLVLSSGHSFHLGTGIPSLGRQLDEEDLPTTNAELAIAGIRDSIRNQKLALTGAGRPVPAAF